MNTGIDNKTGLRTPCHAKEPERCPYHTDHRNMTRQELEAFNEQIVHQSTSTKTMNKNPRSNKAFYNAYTPEITEGLSKLLKEQLEEESIMGTTTYYADGAVIAYPNAFFVNSDTFYYQKDNQTSLDVYNALKKIHTPKEYHEALHSSLPNGAKKLGLFHLMKNNPNAELTHADILESLHKNIARVDFFNDYKGKLDKKDLYGLLDNESGYPALDELIERYPGDLNEVIKGNKELAKRTIGYEAAHNGSVPADALNTALSETHGNIEYNELSPLDSRKKIYHALITNPNVSDENISNILLNSIEFTASNDYDGRQDSSEYYDSSYAEKSELMRDNINDYMERKNCDQAVLDKMIRSCNFTSSFEDSSYYDEDDMHVYNGTTFRDDNDYKTMASIIKKGHMSDDNLNTFIQKNEVDMAHFLLESSVKSHIKPELKKRLRSVLKKPSYFSKF